MAAVVDKCDDNYHLRICKEIWARDSEACMTDCQPDLSDSSSDSTVSDKADSSESDKTQVEVISAESADAYVSTVDDILLQPAVNVEEDVHHRQKSGSTTSTFLTPREFFSHQLKKLEQRFVELENLRRKLLHKHKYWEQFKVSAHHVEKEASQGFLKAAQDVEQYIGEQKEFGRMIYNLTNSPNVNCFGVLDLGQIMPVPRNQWADCDLHNLKLGEALLVFKQRLDQLKIFVDMIRETFFWFVVTGKGERSPVGAPTIKTEVLRYLLDYQKAHNKQKSRMEFAEAPGNEGRIDIVFYYQANAV